MNLVELFRSRDHDILVVDIDGVLFDFVQAWLNTYDVDFSYDVSEIDCWDFAQQYFGLTSQEFQDTLANLPYDDEMLVLEPYISWVRKLIDAVDVPVLFVTSRSLTHFNATERFLDKVFGTQDRNLHMGVANKGMWLGTHYHDHFGRVDTPFILEDHDRQIDQYRNWFPAATIVMPAHPYNTGPNQPDTLDYYIMHEDRHDLTRINTPPSKTDTTPTALRYNTDKPELHYIMTFPHAMDALAKVFSQGAIKYAPYNYLLGGKPDGEYLDAAIRHIRDHVSGDTFDSGEGGIGTMHLANAIWNLMAMIDLNLEDAPTLDPHFDQAGFIAQWSE